jgi:hypothetical protein
VHSREVIFELFSAHNSTIVFELFLSLFARVYGCGSIGAFFRRSLRALRSDFQSSASSVVVKHGQLRVLRLDSSAKIILLFLFLSPVFLHTRAECWPFVRPLSDH